MRRVLLIVMVALLPLKAWAGDAMALQMSLLATQQIGVFATENRATNAQRVSATGLFDQKIAAQPLQVHDCAGQAPALPGAPQGVLHGAPHANEPDSANSAASHDESTGACTHCDACHSLALTSGLSPALSPRQGLGSPVSISPSDTSAERGARHKPPIA